MSVLGDSEIRLCGWGRHSVPTSFGAGGGAGRSRSGTQPRADNHRKWDGWNDANASRQRATVRETITPRAAASMQHHTEQDSRSTNLHPLHIFTMALLRRERTKRIAASTLQLLPWPHPPPRATPNPTW